VSITRAFGQRAGRIRFESGWARDRAVVSHVSRGPVDGGLYLANRGIDEGSYARNAVTFEWHRGVLGEDMIRPGLGASLSYTRGDGELNFQRVDLDLAALRNAGPWRFGARAHAGTVFGDPPPQQLFELGGEGSLAGFDYKQFAGNSAALLRMYALYHLPFLRGPIAQKTKSRRMPEIIIPGVTPALFVSAQGGWAGASNDAARAAILRLGTRAVTDSNGVVTQVPVSITAGNPRGSVGVGISVFEGIVGFGIARPLDRIAKWRGRFAFGLSF
jgi:outer membrane protein assembly factor BamA